jgi:hypothetical protein
MLKAESKYRLQAASYKLQGIQPKAVSQKPKANTGCKLQAIAATGDPERSEGPKTANRATGNRQPVTGNW